MKRHLYRLIAAGAAIGMLAIARPHAAGAASSPWQFGTHDASPIAGDYQLVGTETYYTNGGKDLVFADSAIEGLRMGGSPVFFQTLCAVFHNFVPGAPTYAGPILPPVPGSYSSEDEFGTRTFSFPLPPGSYLTGFGMVSGPDVSETGTNTAGAFFGIGKSTVNGLTDRVAVTQSGWMYYNTVIDTITGGGTETITAQGQGLRTTNLGGGSFVTTAETGALQCQIGPSAAGLNLGSIYYSWGDAEGS